MPHTHAFFFFSIRACALAISSTAGVLSSSFLFNSFIACFLAWTKQVSLLKCLSHRVFPDIVCCLTPHPVSCISVLYFVPSGTSHRCYIERKKVPELSCRMFLGKDLKVAYITSVHMPLARIQSNTPTYLQGEAEKCTFLVYPGKRSNMGTHHCHSSHN